MRRVAAKPVVVAIGDIHFNQNTLPVASAALRQALAKAEELNVDLLINGDLNDTKAIIRAEVANELLEILGNAKVTVYISEGNHDKINEKGSAHCLNFLASVAIIISKPTKLKNFSVMPYANDLDAFKASLINFIPKDKPLFIHQGVRGAFMGDYIVDKTSIPAEDFEGRFVIASHYHRRQTVGPVHFIGSPYTITFGEANDGPKGFAVLYDDNTLEHVPTNLRRHIILDRSVDSVFQHAVELKANDLLWLKVRGPQSELDKLKKKDLAEFYVGHQSFKLDKLPNESSVEIDKPETMTNEQLLDALVDESEETAEQKKYLKALWREQLNASS
jgi:DNA repair exonuclease SbcCD nuclease subunit